jgi:hypothetical protein
MTKRAHAAEQAGAMAAGFRSVPRDDLAWRGPAEPWHPELAWPGGGQVPFRGG